MFLQKLIDRHDLDFSEARALFDCFFKGEVEQSLIAALLTALRMKGETAIEIAAAAASMRNVMIPVEAPSAMDIVGTGGDGVGTYNISTATAFVVAAAGVPVAKHGNRALSSKSGAADVLAAYGVNLDLSPEQISKCIRECNIGFMFAPNHHPATRFVQPVRQALKIRTIFNVLGPLCNPASVKTILMGVYSKDLILPLTEALQTLGVTRALVVHGETDKTGIDECSLSGITHYAHLNGNIITQGHFSPDELGVSSHPIEALIGGNPEENAKALIEVLKGAPSPYAEAVALNGGAALFVAEKAESLKQGVKMAQDILKSGNAFKVLERLVQISKE